MTFKKKTNAGLLKISGSHEMKISNKIANKLIKNKRADEGAGMSISWIISLILLAALLGFIIWWYGGSLYSKMVKVFKAFF